MCTYRRFSVFKPILTSDTFTSRLLESTTLKRIPSFVAPSWVVYGHSWPYAAQDGVACKASREDRVVALGWGDSQEGGGGGGREGGDPFRGIPPSSPSPLLALVRSDQRERRTRMAFFGWLLALDKLLAFKMNNRL